MIHCYSLRLMTKITNWISGWEYFAIIMTIVNHQPKWSERCKTELSGHWSACPLAILHLRAVCTPAILTSSQLLNVPCLVPHAKNNASAKIIFLYLLYFCSRSRVQLNCHLFTELSINSCHPYSPQSLLQRLDPILLLISWRRIFFS